MTYSRLMGTGSYLPEKTLTNADLETMVDTSDAWIFERTGIKQRHIIGPTETTASMAEIASQRALAAANIPAESIDLIIVGTCTPDRVFPSTACLLQARLGIKRAIPAFDVSAACAGFLFAVSVADQYLKNGTFKRALVVGSEALSRVTDWTDRATCVLFGDGAGAVVLEAGEQPGIHSTQIHAQGGYQDLLYLPNRRCAPHLVDASDFVQMKGHDVFKVAVTELGNSVVEALNIAGISQSKIDWLIPHQANLRIIQSVAKRLKLPIEKVILTLETHGNTSSASIPLALDQGIRDGRIQRGHTLLLDAIGGGMAWGASLITY